MEFVLEGTFHKSYGINEYFNEGANVLSKRGDVNKNRIYLIQRYRNLYISSYSSCFLNDTSNSSKLIASFNK
jgi:hypothetical protein